MKYLKTIAVAAGLACTAASSQASITLGYSSGTPNGTIDFTGNGTTTGGATFDFLPAFHNFAINASSGTGDAVGDLGTIGGTFTIGTITTVGLTSTATVSGAGTLEIDDPIGPGKLTADLNWVDITQTLTGNNLNLGGTINLTNVKYTGSANDLTALAANTLGIDTLAFTFTPAVALGDLNSGGGSATFAGTINSAVPEPTTVVAGLLLLLPFGLSTLRVLRRDKSQTAAV